VAEIVGIARFTFHEGRAEDFARLSARCMEIVRERDTGTLQYDVYLAEDGSGAVVVERYRDADALVEHGVNLGEELMAAVLATGSVSGEVLGEPSPELRAALAGSPVRIFAPFLSLGRPSAAS
jgi:quinol monooxygenase YgiN